MKTLKLLLIFMVSGTLFTSCYTEEIIVDTYNPNPTPSISLNQLLNSYELWYVDINETIGYGETPFLQIAFTVSFRNGTLWANNNLVGIGSQGNGYGIPVGDYDAYNMILDVYHDIDGYQTFDVYQINNNTIELYNPRNDTSYFLNGYQRSNFDYDFVFYDNIHYFLQEYQAWEKTYTSATGTINDFDYENYQINNITCDSQNLHIIQLIGMLMNNIKQTIIKCLQITNFDVVIAIPSYWNLKTRIFLLDACKIANLNILKLVNNGIATSLYYHYIPSRIYQTKENP